MDNKQRLALAAKVYQLRASETQYLVTWSGGGEHVVYSGAAGFAAVCALLGLSTKSLGVYLSKGHGAHQFRGTNPTTQEDDIGTVTKIAPPAKQRRPRGRPRKHFQEDNGTIFAESASSMPETRNRRTDEKR